MLLYLHGLNSSPQSHKAVQTQNWLAENHPDIPFVCPQLSNIPEEAIADLEARIEAHIDASKQPVALAGSSMGGYYATYLSEKYGLRAVLINPAVKPYLGLQRYLGENINYHTGESWIMELHHIEQYRALEVEQLLTPENYWTLLQTGDEVLDYRLAEQKYRDGKMTVEQGGDHSFQNYQRFLPEIYAFLFGGNN
ncbi:YqiA/YcfP family alpha/beta fold hydrolase [Porticoccaceae bacterium LTM1]|nr:YqiA/YcfP family alpha/beta fold hydrolase [Porticoccaceae bacterium LTM1]